MYSLFGSESTSRVVSWDARYDEFDPNVLIFSSQGWSQDVYRFWKISFAAKRQLEIEILRGAAPSPAIAMRQTFAGSGY